jgi:hypothetical protein
LEVDALKAGALVFTLALITSISILGSCSTSSADDGTVTLSGNATTSSGYFSTMVGTPTVELQQSGVVKYTLAVGTITNGWTLSPTKIVKGTYDLHVVIQNSSSPPTVGALTVNTVVIDTSGMTYNYTGSYTGDALISGVAVNQDADAEITLQSIPW